MMDYRHAETRSNIRRRRTGCLTCRGRRVRCDEEKPECKNCSRRSRPCVWARDGDKFLYHHPGPATLPVEGQKPLPLQSQSPESARSARALNDLPSDQRRTTSISPNQAFAPLSATSTNSPPSLVTDHYSDSSHLEQGRSSYNVPSVGSTEAVITEEPSCWSNSDLHNLTGNLAASRHDAILSICRSQSSRLKDSIDLEHASPIPPSLEPNGEPFSDWQTLGASEMVVNALEGNKEISLLQTYLRVCAQWFDAVDTERHYSRKCIDRMMACPPWRAAALALSAQHIELQQQSEPTSKSLSIHLYQLAVQLAIDSISGRFDCVGTTAGCVILAVYEMMTVTYRDWRRHLRGCTSIYSHNRWNGDSAGLIRASFWNYARIDIWAAFCARTETMLCTEQWFDYPEKILQTTNLDEDPYAHVATWLLARVNNLIHRTVASPDTLTDHEYCRLRNDLAIWQRMGAAITKPVMQRDADQKADESFATVLFSNESSTIAHILWHTAMVLLLDFKATTAERQTVGVSNQSIYEHARTVCAIIEGSNHSSCVLVEAVQPLWICGRHLRTKSEKFTVLELLAQVERKTGWKTAWRSDDLRDFWCLG